MNFRARFVFSIGLLGLLCLTTPGALRADDFTFSWTNNSGNVAGPVTGEILGLTNNGAPGPASQVILTAYPPTFNVDLGAPPINILPTWDVVSNTFTEAGGSITNANFEAGIIFPDEGDTPDTGSIYLLNSPIYGDVGALGTGACLSLALQLCEYDINYDEGTLVFSPLAISTPEAGTIPLTLTGLGLIGLLLVMRKRRERSFPQAT
jgi:hypothetical protein